MGNDLYLYYNGMSLANLGRKHNFTLSGLDEPLPTQSEIDEDLSKIRTDLLKMTIAYSIFMEMASEDRFFTIKEADDLIENIQDAIEFFEEKVFRAGKLSVLNEMIDEFNEETLEILDDNDVEKKYLIDKKGIY